ncbi:hypothetical protein [Roseococcus sp. SDR]|uniref:hypothetical protein n=1 Tax=Roseococcus sp. SDR TaxID=2835532 RepID=UPI0020BE188A|nr:hypothetical protein [Roseococcus sp. SDR]
MDARIPVSILPEPGALAAALAAGKPAAVVTLAPPGPMPEGAACAVTFEAGVTAHAVACACCQGRSPAAQALDRLFQARVRGQARWFDRVLVLDEEGAGEAVRAALTEDSLAAARFRLA